MAKKIPDTVKAASAIFIIYGVLQLFAFAAFFSGPIITLGSGDLLFIPLFAVFSIFEGIFLRDLKSYSLPLGIVLAIIMLFSIPIGTVLGIFLLFMLYDSRSWLRKKK